MRIQGTVVSRTLPPRYFTLSYLISAWTQRPEDEHRLLSSLLHCFLRHDALPPGALGPELSAAALPVPVTVALPPPEDRAFADVWTALGGELKPSLDLVVSAPVTAAPLYEAGPPVSEDGMVLHLGDDPVPPETRPAAGSGAGVPRRRSARTIFRSVPAGSQSARVRAVRGAAARERR